MDSRFGSAERLTIINIIDNGLSENKFCSLIMCWII